MGKWLDATITNKNGETNDHLSTKHYYQLILHKVILKYIK
jgi:hypothetical protein